MKTQVFGLLVFIAFLSCSFTANASRLTSEFFVNFVAADTENAGTKWAVLVAGSTGWGNYRHQADVCHAYQVLKKAGLNDENIIVFMYDDIAYNENNPRPGIIINKPNGEDVYHGVPKDYTGENATANNFYAAVLGDKSNLTGGSGKVVNSGPDDYIFIYYTDHGGPGVIEMPGQPIFADDLNRVLLKKHTANAYKNMVFYLEACESGSMFEGLLPSNASIYATTASNASENSWAEYCPGYGAPEEYGTCLGDLYSISWLEDCDVQDLRSWTLEQQYVAVRKRTLEGTKFNESSHVMQYGDQSFSGNVLSVYMGNNPPSISPSPEPCPSLSPLPSPSASPPLTVVPQRDADLVHLHHKDLLEAQKQLNDELNHRQHLEHSINKIGDILFGFENNFQVLKYVRPAGQPLVDDWSCLKKLVGVYEKHCGSLATYGLKYMRDFANICNAGVTADQMVIASIRACS
ncbi:hypothetical protein UlMin_041600 [Ulmus minor]